MNANLFRTIIFVLATLALTISPGGTGMAGAENDWNVRRRDRRPIMIRRLKGMLYRQPFSAYALRKLWSIHGSLRARKRLLRYYAKKARQSPNDTKLRIILARMLERLGRWSQALKVYQSIQTTPQTLQTLQLAQVRCYLGLRQPKKAVGLLKTLLPKLPTSQRRQLLRKTLKQAAQGKDAAVFRFVMGAVKKEKWSRHRAIAIARTLVRYQKWDEAFPLYRKALQGMRGQPRMLLLLELIRHQLTAERYNAAQATIKLARKIKTRNRWIAWELLMQEIVVFRGQKQLALLVSRLDRKWRTTKTYKKLILLARLYRELKVMSQAVAYYQKALKVRPSEREPRLRLLTWYSKQKDLEKMRHHLRKLIHYRHATPEHYLQFAGDLLKRSGKYELERWSPAWKNAWYCRRSRYRKRYRYRYRKRYGKRYRYGRRRRSSYFRSKTSKHRCSRKAWGSHRQRRWKFWKRYESNAKRQAMATEAVKLLMQCAKRYPKQWDTLQKIERSLTRYGYPAKARLVRRKMVKTVDAFVYRIENTLQVLFQEGETQWVKPTVRNALRSRAVPLKRAVKVAAFVYRRPIDPADKATKKNASLQEKKQRQWESSFCSLLRRFLRPVSKRIKPSDIQQDPVEVLHVYALLWRCGSRSRALKRALIAHEKRLLSQPQQLIPVMSLYMRYRLKRPLRRLFALLQEQHAERWVTYLKQVLHPSMKPEGVRFLLKQLLASKTVMREQADEVGQVMLRVCQGRRSCGAILEIAEEFSLSPHTPMTTVVSLLKALHRHGQLKGSLKRDWLSKLITSRRSKVHELQQLAEAYLVFYTPTDVRKLHSALLSYVLNHRHTAPSQISLWALMLKRHLRRMNPKYSRYQTDIRRLDKAASRFPALYRKLLSFYLTRYTYRKKFGPEKLLAQLKKGIQLDDLPFLEKVYYRLPVQRREALFLSILNKSSRPETLGWLYTFSRKYKLWKLTIETLRRMLKLRPNDVHLMRQYAFALDRSKTHKKEAEIYWQKWLKRTPERYTPASLRKLAETCCADIADQRLVRRLLVLAPARHKLGAIWPLVKRLAPQFADSEQELLLQGLLAHTKAQPDFRLPLAKLAISLDQDAVAIQLYQTLIKAPKAKATWHRELALALDREQRSVEANAQWKAYLQRARTSDPKVYFRRLGQRFKKRGESHMARLAFYRGWLFGKHAAPPTKDDVEQLDDEKKPLQAWGLWLYLQRDQAKWCLKAQEDPPTLSLGVPQSLWKLNVPYRGPLVLFSRCTWTMEPLKRARLVASLTHYLKHNPDETIALVGGADDEQEPDAAFLARQRARQLQKHLVKAGFSKKRIIVSVPSASLLCTLPKPAPKPRRATPPQPRKPLTPQQKALRKKLLKFFGALRGRSSKTSKLNVKKVSYTCAQYRRQVGITTREEVPVSKSALANNDADSDGVPDHTDPCPLQPSRAYRYRRYGYYRRRRRRLSYRYRRYRRSRRARIRARLARYRRGAFGKAEEGCPPYRPPLRLKALKGETLRLRHPLRFRRRSSSLQTNSRQTLNEVAALLRMVPKLGVLQVEVQPNLLPWFDVYRSRYNRNKSGKSAHAQIRRAKYKDTRLARRRANTIRKYLLRRGLSSSRLKIRLRTELPKTKSKTATPSYVTLRLLSASDPSKP